MSDASVHTLRTIETDIPARMDRLPWSRWHWMIITGLGTVWILDGAHRRRRWSRFHVG